MLRGRPRRPWIKMYPLDCLEGSIRYQLESDERGVWYDILNFGAVCAHPGLIADKDQRPYPHEFIANRLNITLELFERTLNKCIDEGRLSENSNGITIVHWDSYQSEYDRQKPFRQAKRAKEDADKFRQGKYGDNVAQTAGDVKRILDERKRRQNPTGDTV